MNYDYGEAPLGGALVERTAGDGTDGGQGDGAPGGRGPTSSPAPSEKSALIEFRPYQKEAFRNRTNGIELWLWARQVGKSFTLAAWAVDRLITIPGRTVTVLSNSKMNGMELNRKCAEVCRLMGQAFEQVDLSPDNRFETMRAETRVTVNGKTGRILVLAANPRTARGFSGDLILDEFAFQEDSAKIWNEAAPILEGNPGFLCRIASTPNGKHNQFYQMVTDGFYPVRRVTRTDAHANGCRIFHPITREEIDPATARTLARNKRAYDQNYECAFEDENMALLTHELINAAERADVGVVCEGEWSEEAIHLLLTGGNKENREQEWKTATRWLEEAADQKAMYSHLLMKVCNGSIDRLELLIGSSEEIRIDRVYDEARSQRDRENGRALFVGVDVGRNNDRTVISVVERSGNAYLTRAILRLEQMRLPDQQVRLEQVLKLREARLAKIDMTGLGLGLCEYTQQKVGKHKVQGVNFASSVRLNPAADHRTGTVRVTEALATHLLQAFEDRAMQIPVDAALRDDLRRPERLVTGSGQVSIAATRDEAGHADHFWSLALAVDAAQSRVVKPLEWHAWTPRAYRRTVRL